MIITLPRSAFSFNKILQMYDFFYPLEDVGPGSGTQVNSVINIFIVRCLNTDITK